MGGIITCKTSIAILRLSVISHVLANRPVKTTDRNEGQAVGLNILAHLVDRFQCREQLFTLWGVHAIETAVHGWRAGDAHMDLGSPGFPHHLHDFQAGRPAHDTVINQDNFLAIHKWSVGIMLKLHTKMSNTIAWLDKCSADIVGTDNPEFKRNA